MNSSPDFISTIIDGVCESHGTAIDAMPPKVRVFMFAQYFKACVDNGGFVGFIINPSGDYALAKIDALAELGASISEKLLERIVQSFPNGVYPSCVMERETLLGMVDVDSWNAADDAFYKDTDGFDELLVKWVLKHPNDFRL